MDDVTWGALALALTVLGGACTWWAFRRRGVPAGLRALALTLLAPAAWLTGTLGMFTQIARAVSGWATGLVLSPAVWTGIAAAGTSVLLWVVASGIDRRDKTVGRARGTRSVAASSAPPAGKTQGDDEFDEIEELLRRKGIQ